MSSPIGPGRLFRSSREDSDARSAFALASLMMILLPTLLMVTNPQKMVAVPLSLSKPNGTFTPTHTGIVEKNYGCRYWRLVSPLKCMYVKVMSWLQREIQR